MSQEQTLVIIKPDGMQAGLAPSIEGILQANKLEIVEKRIGIATRTIVERHLEYDPQYTITIGEKVLSLCNANHIDPETTFFAGLEPVQVGEVFKELIIESLTSDKTMAMVLSGDEAITRTKKLCGSTFPADAAKDSIRGMFGTDSFIKCIAEKRAPNNIVHAAGDPTEAKHQLNLWFPALVNA